MPYSTMATANKEPRLSELVARITTLYSHASKASDKVVVDALKTSAKQATEELLTLVSCSNLPLDCFETWADFAV